VYLHLDIIRLYAYGGPLVYFAGITLNKYRYIFCGYFVLHFDNISVK